MTTARDIANQRTVQIRAGETWFPSARSSTDVCHRNTMTKVNKYLKERRLISDSSGTKIQVVTPTQSNISQVVEKLLLDRLSPDEIQRVIEAELNKRKSVKIISKQSDLIENELRTQGIAISPNGLIVSDDPSEGEFHLYLTNFSKYKQEKHLNIPSTVGIITQSEYFFLQASVGLGGNEDVIYMKGDTLQRQIQVAKMCRLVITDSLHSDFSDLARKIPVEYRAVEKILNVPYLQQNSIIELKKRLLPC